jgi:hypothetical protein
MLRDLGQTRLVREVKIISQSHKKPTTKMISLLNLTVLDSTQPQLLRVPSTNK